MVRMFQYFGRYGILSEDAQDFLRNRGRVMVYNRQDTYLHADEVKNNWCFILEGVVGMEHHDASSNIQIEQVLAENDYFNGSKHPFSASAEQTHIRFYKQSAIYELPHIHFRKAIEEFTELQHLYHILKQQQLNRLRHFLRLAKISREERLAYFHTHFPNLATRLTVRQISSLLGYSTPRQYYHALAYYIRHA